VNNTELQMISSYPQKQNNDWFSNPSYEILTSITRIIGQRICAAAVSMRNDMNDVEKEAKVHKPVNLFFLVEVPVDNETFTDTYNAIDVLVKDVDLISPDTEYGLVLMQRSNSAAKDKKMYTKDELLDKLKSLNMSLSNKTLKGNSSIEKSDAVNSTVKSDKEVAGNYEAEADTGSEVDKLNQGLVEFYARIYSEQSRPNHLIIIGDLIGYKVKDSVLLSAILTEISDHSKLYAMGIHAENKIKTIFGTSKNITIESDIKSSQSTVPLISKIFNIKAGDSKKEEKTKKVKFEAAKLESPEPEAANLIIASGVYCYKTAEAGLQCFCHVSDCNIYPTNSTSCQDINECNDPKLHGCSYNCVNTQGSYYCTCPNNLRLAMDKQLCSDYNECVDEPCGRSYTCINTVGSYICINPTVVRSYESALLETNGEEKTEEKTEEEHAIRQTGNIMGSATVSTSSSTLILACTVGALGGAVFVLSMYMIIMRVQRKKRATDA